jgi:hypothetical protein
MGVQTTKAAEAALGHALPLQVGKEDLPGVADAHPLDFSLAVDEDPDLAPDVPRDFGELPGELLGDQGPRGQLPLVELLQAVTLARLEPDDVAFETVNKSP